MQLTPSQAELITSCRVAIVATQGPDGSPHLTATWFDLGDDGMVRVSIASMGQKARNLERDSHATLFFIDPKTSLHTVELRGTMTVEPDAELTFAKKVGAKHGDDLSQYLQPGEIRLTATLHPTKVVEFRV
jgi:PPOX class probable F420-dependent enzyme